MLDHLFGQLEYVTDPPTRDGFCRVGGGDHQVIAFPAQPLRRVRRVLVFAGETRSYCIRSSGSQAKPIREEHRHEPRPKPLLRAALPSPMDAAAFRH